MDNARRIHGNRHKSFRVLWHRNAWNVMRQILTFGIYCIQYNIVPAVLNSTKPLLLLLLALHPNMSDTMTILWLRHSTARLISNNVSNSSSSSSSVYSFTLKRFTKTSTSVAFSCFDGSNKIIKC